MVSAIESNDRLRYNSVISLAGTLNDDAGTPACYDPQIEFETVFAPNVALVTTDPTIPATPTCPAPAFAVPWSIPALTAESAAVEIREFCALEGPFEDSVRGNLLALLPPGFQTRASGLLRFSAADVGAPVQTCTCHSECAGNRIRGGGSACVGGFCDVAIDVDRVVMMPEGFDIVVAESSSDPQASILPAALALLDPIVVLGLRGAASCDPNRIPTIASDGSPRVFTVPAVFDPPSI